MEPIQLTPRPPFDFSLTAAIFSGGDPGIRSFRDNVFSQVLDTGRILVLAEVRSHGSVDEPGLSLTLRSSGPLVDADRERAAGLIATILSIHDDPGPFYRAVAGDPVMADLTRRLRGVRAPVTPTVFEALTDSIIEQQISLKAAASIEKRLVRATGRTLVLDGTVFYAYPDPASLAATPDETFRTCGLTRRKGEYIRDISRKIADGELDLEGFRTCSETGPVIGELVRQRGIGRWTAELTILRGLHLPDAFPADDVGVRRFISRFYLSGKKITAAEARVFAERWGDWKGFAAYYLEVAERMGMAPAA